MEECNLLSPSSVFDPPLCASLMPNRIRPRPTPRYLRCSVAALLACHIAFGHAMPPETPLASLPATASAALASAPRQPGGRAKQPGITAGTHANPHAQPSPVVPMPPSEAYGALYRDVELAHLFPDSKTFADMVPNAPPQQIVAAYTSAKPQPGFNLAAFVHQYFVTPQHTVKPYVSDPNQDVVGHIDTLWDVLRRDPDASASPWSSLLPLPDPYIVPGGRFD
jgi:alpha,alpha-trehalase